MVRHRVYRPSGEPTRYTNIGNAPARLPQGWCGNAWKSKCLRYLVGQSSTELRFQVTPQTSSGGSTSRLVAEKEDQRQPKKDRNPKP